ncbi:MAG: DUF882 domain-containing protein [Deltaproteobacteria bacterium]|nr:DUF882 domain-containing protein [Myxococcales bacterium]MDP3219118.1 DUF882 domain-containing protein [Deltaproteobacteria bacterium]
MTGSMVRASCAWIVGGALLVASRAPAQDLPVPPFLPPSPARLVEHDRAKKGVVEDVPTTLVVPAATLVNVHTHEAIVLDGAASERERERVEWFLRDRTNWERHAISPLSLETLRASVLSFGARRVEVVSGYRSDKLNEGLRKKGRHVAARSQHVLGNAIDFRLMGVPTAQLLAWVTRFHRGGVGFYPRSGFIHVDAGRPRRWNEE